MHKLLLLSLLAAAPAAAPAVAPAVARAQAGGATVAVENAWARATSASARTGAVYLTVVDRGPPDRLVAVSTPLAETTELHETIRDGDVVRMRPANSLPVAPDRPLTFAPGGYHIMLVNLARPLRPGEGFPLTLTFQNAGAIQTTVQVRAAGAAGDTPMDGHAHGAGMEMPMAAPHQP